MSADNTNQSELDQLETQAKQIAGLLDAHAQRLSMRTLKKLEDGRKSAVKAHEQRVGHTTNADGTLGHLSTWANHHKLAFRGLVAASIVAVFMVSQSFIGTEASDAFLLGADLPPEAFVDRGFEPSLNRLENI